MTAPLNTRCDGFLPLCSVFCQSLNALPDITENYLKNIYLTLYAHHIIMSGDDTDLMPQVFVVEGDDDEFDLDIPPTSGMDYLRRVQ